MLPHKPIAESKRRDERELEATFGIAAPEILGALLDGLAAGLRNLANVQMDDKPRMADFALWAEACTRAYWPADTFLKAYRDNLANSVELVLEASPVGIAVRTFMATRSEWKGAAGTLLPLLTALVGEQAAKERSWPKRGNELGGKLRRVTPALRKTGIHVVFERDGHARTIRIEARGQPEQRGDSSSWSSPSSPSEQKEGGINDVGTNPGDNGVPFDDSTMTSPDSDSVTASPLKSRGNDGCDGNDDDLHHSSGNGGSVPNDYDAVLEELVAQGWQPTAKVTIREIPPARDRGRGRRRHRGHQPRKLAVAAMSAAEERVMTAGSNWLAELAARIRSEHEAVGSAVRSALDHAVAAGQMLIEAKSSLPHGGWLLRLRSHCKIPPRTASHYMRLAKRLPEIGKGCRFDRD